MGNGFPQHRLLYTGSHKVGSSGWSRLAPGTFLFGFLLLFLDHFPSHISGRCHESLRASHAQYIRPFSWQESFSSPCSVPQGLIMDCINRLLWHLAPEEEKMEEREIRAFLPQLLSSTKKSLHSSTKEHSSCQTAPLRNCPLPLPIICLSFRCPLSLG